MDIVEAPHNKRVEDHLYETYDSTLLLKAVDKFDEIRDFIESDEVMRNEIREQLMKLHGGVASITGNNFCSPPTVNMGHLASEISDQLYDVIELARDIQRYLEPLKSLGMEDGDEDDCDLLEVEGKSDPILSFLD